MALAREAVLGEGVKAVLTFNIPDCAKWHTSQTSLFLEKITHKCTNYLSECYKHLNQYGIEVVIVLHSSKMSG